MTDLKVAGVFVSWALCESFDGEALREGFEKAGIPAKTPENRSMTAALRHVLVRDYSGRGRNLASVGGTKGVFVVSEAVGEDVDAVRTQMDGVRDIAKADITLREVCRAWVARAEGFETVEASGSINLEHLRAEVKAAQASVDQRALSIALGNALEKWHAVRLREAGGAYFLPGKYQSNWEALREAVAGAALDGGKARLAMARIVADSDAGQAIVAGLGVEIAQKVADIHYAIAHNAGEGRLDTLAAAAYEMQDTIKVYEDLLGETLASLHEQCQQAIVAAGDARALAAANRTGRKARTANAGPVATVDSIEDGPTAEDDALAALAGM